MSGKTCLGVVGGTAADYNLLDTHLNELIEKSQCYLFTILCSVSPFDDVSDNEKPLSLIWAEKNGCPLQYIQAEDSDKLINLLFSKATYIIFILHKDDIFTKKLFMRYKMTGKHGSVIYAD